MKTFKKILVAFLIVVILVAAFIAYFGFVPFMSKILGTANARDLGVKYTQMNYTDYILKAKVAITPIKEAQSKKGKGIEFEGKTAVEQSFSQEELSARLNYSVWKYMPVSNSQVKVNPDGSVEFSANINTNNLPGFVETVGGLRFSKDEADKAINMINKVATNPAVYAKFTATVENNQPTIHVQALQLGRINVPIDAIGGDDAVKSVVEHVFTLVPGLDVQSLTFDSGKMNFKGTAPTVELVPSN